MPSGAARKQAGPNRRDGMGPGFGDEQLEFDRSCRVLAGVLQCICG
jgi:hypothetical protein